MTAARRLDLPGTEGAAGDGEPWSVALAGDCIYESSMADEPVGAALRERFERSTLALANLEAPVPGGEPVAKSGPTKQSAPDAPAVLAAAGVDAVALANNHAMDYGVGGLRATERACADAGLATVGAGEDADAALAPLERSVPGGSLAVVNVCEREFGVATDDEPGTAWVSHPHAERRVEAAADAHDAVLVVEHGGVEYAPLPPAGRQRRLRSFVDAGADAVVGHHPHVAQGWEVYDGAPVVYSLGNFLFDQSARPSTGRGLVVELAFAGGTPAALSVVPVERADGGVREQPDGEERDAFCGYLDRSSALVADRERLRAHWQELADRLFDQRYAGWLRTGTAAGPLALLRDPRAALGDPFDATERPEALLTLLNVVRNESHRETIETALAVRAGDAPDLRTDAVEREVRELLTWTEDRPVYDRPSTPRKLLRAVRDRL